MSDLTDEKAAVQNFWSRNINQFNQLKRSDVGAHAFYEAAEELRFKYHYHLPPLFDHIAAQFPNGKLIEVGCSIGNDSIQLARRGLDITGVDLTEAAITLARERFAANNMSGQFHVADAENLPFSEDSFDVAYSFGVLHHTPDTARAIDELRRVLRPGGVAYVMLYNRHSLNYFAHWITGIPYDGSKADPCPVEKCYSPRDVRTLFTNFGNVRLQIEYLFGTGWGVANRIMPQTLHRFLGRHFGWHIMITATK